MKVKHLIEELRKRDQEARVVVYFPDTKEGKQVAEVQSGVMEPLPYSWAPKEQQPVVAIVMWSDKLVLELFPPGGKT